MSIAAIGALDHHEPELDRSRQFQAAQHHVPAVQTQPQTGNRGLRQSLLREPALSFVRRSDLSQSRSSWH